jgi:hypothetical protein
MITGNANISEICTGRSESSLTYRAAKGLINDHAQKLMTSAVVASARAVQPPRAFVIVCFFTT